jgi:hypothetical protein
VECDRSSTTRADARASHVAAHRLRHALASELLREGAALIDLGQVLSHKSAAVAPKSWGPPRAQGHDSTDGHEKARPPGPTTNDSDTRREARPVVLILREWSVPQTDRPSANRAPVSDSGRSCGSDLAPMMERRAGGKL